MLIYIDESGDPGFNIDKGSSENFVICMVIFPDGDEAYKAWCSIDKLKLRLKRTREFKFNKSSSRIRNEFFNTVLKLNFKVRALVVIKKNFNNEQLKSRKDKFYNHFVEVLIKSYSDSLVLASIKIDEHGDKKFKRELTGSLSANIGREKIRKLKLVDSKNDNLIQLADMMAGAIAKSFCIKKNSSKWKNIIDEKIEEVIVFGSSPPNL